MTADLRPMLVDWALAHQPDVIVSSDTLAHIAHRLRKASGAPLVLHVETWFDERFLGRRYHLGISPLAGAINAVRRRWVGRNAARIMIASPAKADPFARR